jgi:hypothetical protein
VAAYDLLGALKILCKEKWFTCDEYNKRLLQHKLFFYEKRDQPHPLKPSMKQDRLQGKAMGIMVHLRKASDEDLLMP